MFPGVKYEVEPARAGLATLEARRADACCKFIEGIQSGRLIARLLCYNKGPHQHHGWVKAPCEQKASPI